MLKSEISPSRTYNEAEEVRMGANSQLTVIISKSDSPSTSPTPLADMLRSDSEKHNAQSSSD